IEEVVRVDGADPYLEIGALYELSLEHEVPPVLLFENIKGCPPEYRIVSNVRGSAVFDSGLQGLEAVQAHRQRRKHEVPNAPIPPVDVESGPIFDNILMGEDVHVLKFPAPRWHEDDGGEYIGTECLVIQKDPDSDWVNVATYRVQVQDDKTLTVFID